MYGAEFSLCSGKLRSYLRKKGIKFTEKQPWLLPVLVDTARILDEHSDGIGAGDLFEIKQQVRLKRENNRLYLDH